MVLRIRIKKNHLRREGGITRLLEVTAMEGYLMEKYSSREPFGFEMTLLGSTRRPTNVNKSGVTDLKRILCHVTYVLVV